MSKSHPVQKLNPAGQLLELGKRSSTQSGECASLLSCIMSGKMKSRASANSTDSATVTVNEKILKECHSLYTDSEKGWFSSQINIIYLLF